MTLTPPERDETVRFEVTVWEDEEKTQTVGFDTLEEAERFVENWNEQVPGARCEIEATSHDHTAWEDVEADTAQDQDYPTGAQQDEYEA